MLKRMRIQNFKAWQDTGDVRLAPLTVFFGGNSAGKSSLQHLLLLLRQTTQSADRQQVLHFGDNKTAVDLGSFDDVIFKHESNTRNIDFELEWETSRPPMSITDVLNDQVKRSGSNLTLSAQIAHAEGRGSFVRGLRYALGDPETTGLAVSMEESKKPGEYRLSAENLELKRQRQRSWPLPPPLRFYGFPDEATAYYQNTAFVQDLSLEFELAMNSLYYVGPLREYPKRVYQWSGERPSHVGDRGEAAVGALLAGRGRKFNRVAKGRSEEFHTLIASWLQKMGLIAEFEASPIGKGRKEHEVIVRTIAGGTSVKITDVGFGISQVLPVLVECFYVPERSTIIFEQPEIHLHPSVQAALADLFIESIAMREGGKLRQTQLIVESHSEHLLRRLQRRIAEGVIKADDVAIYFASPGANGSTLQALKLDTYGNISNWPENFFGDSMGDLTAMMEAQMKLRLGES